jgi:hypothetical protein
LTVDTVKLPQSASIARYVAKELGLAGKLIKHSENKLLKHKNCPFIIKIGENNLAQAQADAICDCLVEVQNIYYSDVAFVKTEKVVFSKISYTLKYYGYSLF